MASPPKSDQPKKPRPSRARSGKPAPPPVETVANTPGFGEAPSPYFAPADTRSASRPAGALPTPARLAWRGRAVAADGRRKPDPTALNALLTKPEERSDRAKAMLARQPLMATHPIVAGTMPKFMPHRPERPEKSEGGIRSSSSRSMSRRATSRRRSPNSSPASTSTSATRCCSASPARARPSRWRNVIEATQRPALILAPNKTLAAQLYGEFKSFFPDNAVEYFVSYYDYYQPEAYVPRTDTYIEKEASINEQIDRMRHSATRALLERDDVIIVASVSCIYGIGSVETYTAMTFSVKMGEQCRATSCSPISWRCTTGATTSTSSAARSACAATRSKLFPAHLEDRAWRFSMFGDEIEAIVEFDPLTGEKTDELELVKIYANSHYVTPKPTLQQAIKSIKVELKAAPRRVVRRRQAARSAAAGAAHDVRHGNDGGDRLAAPASRIIRAI